MTVLVKVYDNEKYIETSKVVAEKVYTVKSWEVTTIQDSLIYSMGFDTTDPYFEYLILTTTDNEKITFRNSYVDLFQVKH